MRHEDEEELLSAIAKIPKNEQIQKVHPPKLPPYFPPGSGLPFNLRPPQNMNFPFYQTIKIPQRRPVHLERRPVHRKPIRNQPFLIPQQSSMVSTYRRPSPQLNVRNYIKPKPQPMPSMPGKPITPFLLLGEPTEIKPTYKKSPPNLVIGKPSKTQINISPMFKIKQDVDDSRLILKHNIKKTNKNPPRSTFKDPFDIKAESATSLKEAANTGFKADTIIVESGFRPIFRREDVVMREKDSQEESNERISHSLSSASRRSDDFDDTLEGEKSFEQPQSTFFEPMFIPSPTDSAALHTRKNLKDSMIADASEKQDFFYLPPSDSKRSAVTYDAKAILDTSLLNDPLPSENDFIKLSSKTKQFIKETPQFAPFKGELPSDLMLQISTNREAQSIVPKDRTSTKLSAVKTNES